MNFNSIIEKKKKNIELNESEINFLIEGFLNNKIKDYQMSAFLMAVYFNNMTKNELYFLTNAMIRSGKKYDLEGVEGPIADKHSTGGVGDKTSLIYAPLVASFGIKVAKISGRGLGKTGGTIDKLESCTGWTSLISEEEFNSNVKNKYISIIGQSENIVPADKVLYALRDVTGTVDSIPLIASSIMSKKLAVRNTSIILDVKVGSGAFMQNIDDALLLANTMIEIGNLYNRNVSVILTNMNFPLGRSIGNALEVKEAWETLNGNGCTSLEEISTTAAAITLLDNGIFNDYKIACEEINKVIKSKKAANLLKEFVINQNGDFDKIINYDDNFKTKNVIEIRSEKKGYLNYDSNSIGNLSLNLGAGRETKEDKIDFASGIYLNKLPNEFVNENEIIFTLYTNKDSVEIFKNMSHECYKITDNKNESDLILKIISKNYNL